MSWLCKLLVIDIFSFGELGIQIKQIGRWESRVKQYCAKHHFLITKIHLFMHETFPWGGGQGSNCVIAPFYQTGCFLAWSIFRSNPSHWSAAPPSPTPPWITTAAGNPICNYHKWHPPPNYMSWSQSKVTENLLCSCCHIKRSSNARHSLHSKSLALQLPLNLFLSLPN